MAAIALADFIDMGGDALYVWGSYVMVVAIAAWEAWMLVLRRRRALDDIGLQILLQDVGPRED